MDFYIVLLLNNCDPLLKIKVQISKSIHSALCKRSSIDGSSPVVVAGPVALCHGTIGHLRLCQDPTSLISLPPQNLTKFVPIQIVNENEFWACWHSSAA